MNKQNKISVVICTFNEENNIKRCLESVGWVDEIVIVDTGSTDKTVSITQKYTKNIYHHENVAYVEPSRNFAISKATGDWILILDADEEIPSFLANNLLSIVGEKNDISFVEIPRKNIIFDKWIQHTGWWPDKHIRFFKKGTVTWKDEIHSIPTVIGEKLSLDGEANAIIHHNYASISQFFHKNLEIYAKQEANELLKNGYQFDFKDVIRFPMREFLSRYFAREGYKDGFAGLMLSFLMAIYHFTVFAYLWENEKYAEINNRELTNGLSDELKKAKKEFMYWQYTKNIMQEKNGLRKIVLKLKRKMKV
jgi:glycosyltransferase involved in cell wall biosynthesis